MQYVLRWDMLDAHFPWLFYMSEAFSVGEFPFWNPYQQLGYPFYTDPQVTPWYPIAHLATYFSRFSIHALHLYFMFHIYVAGIGFYKLLHYFKLSKPIALILGLSYGLSGFFAANGEHLLIITAAAWIPFTFKSYIENIDVPCWLNTAKLSIFTSLLITGGYPQLTIILCYFLLFISIIKSKKLIEANLFKSWIFYNVLAALFTIIITLPFFVALYESIDFVNRGGGISLEKALTGSLTIKALIYNLIPFSLIKNSPANFDANTSLNNLYFGVIPLCFFLTQLLKPKKTMDWFLIVFGTCCLLASLGKELPVREFLYHYVPLMQYFRFPSLFRLFSIICFLILAGNGLQKWKLNSSENKPILMGSSLLLMIIIAVLIIPQLEGVFSGKYDFSSFEKLLHSFSFNDHVVFHGFIQLIILSAFIYFIKNKSIKGIGYLAVIDVLLALQLNINYSLVLPPVSPQAVQKKVNELPRGFPPPTRPKLKDAFRDRVKGVPLWRNAGILIKEPAFDAFTSVLSVDHINFMKNYSVLKDSVFENPPFYLSTHVFPIDLLDEHKKQAKLTRSNVYISQSDFQEIDTNKLKTGVEDQLTALAFGPNNYEFKVKSENQQLLVLLQTYFKGWKVLINNNPTKLIKANTLFISALIPEGTSTVTFVYENKKMLFLYSISCTVLIILILLVILSKKPVLD